MTAAALASRWLSTCAHTVARMYTGCVVSIRRDAGRCARGKIHAVEVDSHAGMSAPAVYAWVEDVGRVPLSACLLRAQIAHLPAGVLDGGEMIVDARERVMSPAWIEVCRCAWGARKEVVCAEDEQGQVYAYDTDTRLRLPVSYRQVNPDDMPRRRRRRRSDG